MRKKYYCDKCDNEILSLECCTNEITKGSYCSYVCSEQSRYEELERRNEEVKHAKLREPTGFTPDPIKPSHYHHGGLDVFTIMEKNMPQNLEGFFVGNVLKYVMRYEYKNGLEDIKKAKEYLEKLIELKS